jgi:Flp pilus assembly protein TadG
MNIKPKITGGGKRWQHGVAAVEFALVAILLFTLIFSILEFGRALFVWNSIAEATRLGARLAVVCDKSTASDDAIKTRMENFVQSLTLTNANIVITYFSAILPANACDQATCTYVQVKITGASFSPVIPMFSLTIPLPDFATTLPRESMDSAGGSNPVCP